MRQNRGRIVAKTRKFAAFRQIRYKKGNTGLGNLKCELSFCDGGATFCLRLHPPTQGEPLMPRLVYNWPMDF
jgi:hypothetical protein